MTTDCTKEPSSSSSRARMLHCSVCTESNNLYLYNPGDRTLQSILSNKETMYIPDSHTVIIKDKVLNKTYKRNVLKCISIRDLHSKLIDYQKKNNKLTCCRNAKSFVDWICRQSEFITGNETKHIVTFVILASCALFCLYYD